MLHGGRACEHAVCAPCLRCPKSSPALAAQTRLLLTGRYPNYGVPESTGIFYAPNKLFCVDLLGGNAAWRTPIQLWTCNGLVNQAWQFVNNQIVLAGSNYPGKCIDLPGGDTRNGNQIWLWQCTGGPEQQWGWDASAERIYYLANNQYCLDLPSGDAKNGNQLQLWECNGLDSQKWALSQDRLRAETTPPSKAAPVAWMHDLLRSVHTMRDTHHSHTVQSRGRLPADINGTIEDEHLPWYERRAMREWYARQGPARQPSQLTRTTAVAEQAGRMATHVRRTNLTLDAGVAEAAEEMALAAEGGVQPARVGGKMEGHVAARHVKLSASHANGAGGYSGLRGDTQLTTALNGMIAASPGGDFRGGGKGVLIRAPDYLEQGRVHVGEMPLTPRFNLSVTSSVVPASFLHNDIIAPSIVYPSLGGGGGNPMCPNQGSTGFSSAPYCPPDQASGETGPWNFAQLAYVIGINMPVMFEKFDELQSDTWGYGVFYGSDSNSVDKRCKYFADADGWDCPGYWLDSDGHATPYSDRHGAGVYPAGNPYVNSKNGGGAGCHFDPSVKQIDQTDAINYDGDNLVSDKHCQCNYKLKGGAAPWKDWVYQWLDYAQPKSGELWQGWFKRGKAPSFALDFTACWTNNPRDMIGLQNALYFASFDWNNFLIPQAGYDWNTPASWRGWWGWNEVPVSRATMDDPTNWDAIVIKLPPAICGHDGADDMLHCLSDKVAYNLEHNLDQLWHQNLLVPGANNAKSRPGSSVVILKEQQGSNVRWFRVFYCEAWTSPTGTWEVVYDPAHDGCYLTRH